MSFCEDCKHLNPTEEQQNKMAIKVSHRCEKLNARLYHFNVHPSIVMHPDCPGKELE